MTNYSRSAYGTNVNAGRQRNNAAARGWGSGWPNCQSSKMVKVTNGDHSAVVRREISALVAALFKLTAKYGYDINPKGQVNQTWGFACRAIRGTNSPSNHSWGLAVDINSLANPMQSTFKSNIPPRVVRAWELCGFYWGGRYSNRPDAMHFEYIGRPQDVAKDLAEALAMLNPASGGGGGSKPVAKGTVLHLRRIQNCAKGFALQLTDPAYDEVTALLNWCERLTARGGRALLDATDGTETWQRAIRQKAYGPAGTYLRAVIINLQKRYGLVADGIFGPKTAAVAASDGFVIQP